MGAHLLRYAAPCLLLIFALAQQVLVRATNISPWKGSGFGMFATVDDPRQRQLSASVLAEDVLVFLDLETAAANRKGLARRMRRAQYVPTPNALQILAESLTDLHWTLSERDGRARLVPELGDEGGNQLGSFGGRLRLELRARRMQMNPLAVVLERRAKLDVEL